MNAALGLDLTMAIGQVPPTQPAISPGFWTALIMVNIFALIVSSHAYTAWSIRVRNEMYYAILRRDVNRQRALDADEIAEDVVRWLRPLIFIGVNAIFVYIELFAPHGR